MISDIDFPKFSEYIKAKDHREAIEKASCKIGEQVTIDGVQWVIDLVNCTQEAPGLFELYGKYRLATNEDHPRLYGVTHA